MLSVKKTPSSLKLAGSALAGGAAVLVALSASDGRLGLTRATAAQETATPPNAMTLATPVSPQNIFVNISERLMPSVVNIFTTKNIPTRRDPWGDFFGDPRGMGGEDYPSSRAYSLGTGFVIEADSSGGLILTNHHVIAGADEVKIKFTESNDEAESTAEVIGKDPELDIALLRVKTKRKLQPVALGDSEQLKVGEWIAAMGNPFGHGHSVSHGIVSAKARTLPGGFGKYLQVDAPINPGNSGGPLVNMNGEVVGINNAIDARGPGIGFAIPINAVKAMLTQLKSDGHVERGYIGINVMPLRPELARALKAEVEPGTPVVANVAPGTPAAKAGLEPYDIVSRVDGHALKSPEDLVNAILQVPVGKKVKAEVIRGGKKLTLDVTVSRRPSPQRS